MFGTHNINRKFVVFTGPTGKMWKVTDEMLSRNGSLNSEDKLSVFEPNNLVSDVEASFGCGLHRQLSSQLLHQADFSFADVALSSLHPDYHMAKQ